MEEEHQDPNNLIYGVLRNLKNIKSREEEEGTVNQQRYLSCCYGLRKNPKKKTHKSFGESMKKILFRCEECGKGFRYEKCLSNHQAGVHFTTNQRVYEESVKNLCSSFSVIRKKKRSRVIRYKKIPLSWSFTKFPELRSGFATIDEELEVAECLILLSLSSPNFVDGLKHISEAIDANSETPRCSFDSDSGCFSNKKPRKACDFESGFLCDDTFQGKESFLGHKYELDQPKLKGGEFGTGFLKSGSFLGEKNELDQLKLRKSGDFESKFLSTEVGVNTMECSDSDTEMVTETSKKNEEQHQCRLCNKIFSSYQALGGHQTFHRVSKSKKKKNNREESLEEEHRDESLTVTNEKERYKCSICSRLFRSVHALGGHKKSHSSKRHQCQ